MAAKRRTSGSTDEPTDSVSVELAHHWTDPDGDPHLPGETVEVTAEVAAQLVGGTFGHYTDDTPTGEGESDSGPTSTPTP